MHARMVSVQIKTESVDDMFAGQPTRKHFEVFLHA